MAAMSVMSVGMPTDVSTITMTMSEPLGTAAAPTEAATDVILQNKESKCSSSRKKTVYIKHG